MVFCYFVGKGEGRGEEIVRACSVLALPRQHLSDHRAFHV